MHLKNPFSIKHASEGDKHLYRRAKTNHRHIRGLERGRSEQKGDRLSGQPLNSITFICLKRSSPVTGANSTWGQGASNGAIYYNKNICEGNIAKVVQRTNRISQQGESLDKYFISMFQMRSAGGLPFLPT